MLRINQTIDSVTCVRNDMNVVVVRNAVRAHRLAPAKPLHLGKRPADLLAGKKSSTERLCSEPGGGWCPQGYQQSYRSRMSGTSSITARFARDLPAAAWARLQLSRAVSA